METPNKYKVILTSGEVPTVPTPSTLTPLETGWRESDILIGQWAYNVPDNKWYVRDSYGIHEQEDPQGGYTKGMIEGVYLYINPILEGIGQSLAALQAVAHEHGNYGLLETITHERIQEWNDAYNWGNHAEAGYLRGVDVYTKQMIDAFFEGDMDGKKVVDWKRVINKPEIQGDLVSMFELKQDGSGIPYISAKIDIVAEKGVTAYSAAEALVPSIWEGMPTATTENRGAIIVGQHLTIENGVLSVNSDNLGLNADAVVNVVNTDARINAYLAQNASMLGGNQPDYYATADHNHDQVYLALALFSQMFELKEDVNQQKYIQSKLDLFCERGVTAYASTTALVPDIWAGLPVATSSTLGGVMVSPNSGLLIDAGQLRIDGDTFNLTHYYTKTNLETQGQAHVHWGNITTGKPTSLIGYGITDAYTKTESDGKYSLNSHNHNDLYLALETWNQMFTIQEDANQQKYIQAKLDMFCAKGITAYASTTALVPSLWDDMPVATTTSRGGVKVGSGLVMVGEHLSLDGNVFNLTNYYTKEDIINNYIPLSQRAAANGVATLDSGGKVHLSQLPSTLLVYKGVWNASTNSPSLLSTDTAKKGWVYNVGTAGTQFGIAWKLGDWAIYNDAGVLEKSDNSDDVVSVNGQQGTVVLSTSHITEGTNLYYTNTRARAAISASGVITYSSSTGALAHTDSSSVRHVTDTQMAAWNAKVDRAGDTMTGALGIVRTLSGGSVSNLLLRNNATANATEVGIRLCNHTSDSVMGAVDILATRTNSPTYASKFIVKTNRGSSSSLSTAFQVNENGDFIVYGDIYAMGGIVAYSNAANASVVWDSMPAATATTLGGIKVGSGLSISSGVLSVTGDSFNLTNYYSKTDINAFLAGTTAIAGYNKSSWDTAYSVRQQWSGVSTNLDAATGRASLDVAKKQSSTTDTTAGRGLIVGAFGLGGVTPSGVFSSSIINQFIRDTIVTPTGNLSVYGINIMSGQIDYALHIGGRNDRLLFSTRENSVQTSWRELYHTGNLGTGTAGYIPFWTGTNTMGNSANLIWDNGNGRLGIGITSPLEMSDIYRNSAAQSATRYTNLTSGNSATNGFLVGIEAAGNGIIWNRDNNFIRLGTNATERMRITSGGNVLIGKTTVTSGYMLDVNGAIRAAGNIVATGEVTAYSASSKLLKTNVSTLTDNLSVLDRLRPVQYQWNDLALELNPTKDERINYGVIAEELEAVMPELVHTIHGKYKAVDYVQIIPLLVGAIKELKQEVNNLKRQ